MSRYSLISVILIAFAVISCQSKEPREAITTTAQSATVSATDSGTIAEAPPATTSAVVPTATSTTAAPSSTPAVKPAAATPVPRATAPKPVAATPKPPPEASTPATTPAQQPPAPAAEPATTPAEPTPAKAAEPVATTPPAKAPTTKGNPPKTHTVDHGGVKHAPGSDNPTQKCAVCHGKDLRGGKVAKASCFGCHEKVWK